MKAKALLIPIAAFAVTVTGVSAFNSDILQNAGLNDDQINAFEAAHELRMDGDREGARDILMDAGVDQDTMEQVRESMKAYKEEHKEAVHDAVEDNDYDAFQDAIEGSPIADIVTSESDFDLFVEAYELREAGDHEAAKEIMEELGFEGKKGHGMGHKGMKGGDHAGMKGGDGERSGDQDHQGRGGQRNNS